VPPPSGEFSGVDAGAGDWRAQGRRYTARGKFCRFCGTMALEARATAKVAREPAPAEQTLRLLNEGRSFEEIARHFDRARFRPSFATVASLIETGQVKLDSEVDSPDAQPLIEAACLKQGLSG